VPERDRRLDVGVGAEIAVDQLHIGAAHAARLNLDEDLVRGEVANRNVIEDEGLAIFEQACGFHVFVLSWASGCASAWDASGRVSRG